MFRHVNIMIQTDGTARLAPLSLPHGYQKDNPVVRIVGVPPGVSSDEVLDKYSGIIVMPVMHAETPIPWAKIMDAQPGDIVRLNRGRPHVPQAEKAVRINITLSPAALEILDARGNGRSQEIERLILASKN